MTHDFETQEQHDGARDEDDEMKERECIGGQKNTPDNQERSQRGEQQAEDIGQSWHSVTGLEEVAPPRRPPWVLLELPARGCQHHLFRLIDGLKEQGTGWVLIASQEIRMRNVEETWRCHQECISRRLQVDVERFGDA